MRMTTASRTAAFFAIALLAAASPARAEDVNGAAKAFSEAQTAMLTGDAARAADLYELADELAPSAPALRNATRARLAAGHLAMAATNAAALARRYPNDTESRELADAVLEKLAPQLAQLGVACTPACTVLLDGRIVVSAPRRQHTLFIQPGTRTVTAVFDGARRVERKITAMTDRATAVKLDAPAAPVAPRSAASPAPTARARPEPRSGLSRWWVVIGGVTTLGIAAAATASGMETLTTRDQVRAAVAAGNDPEARHLYDRGRDLQLRTNVLMGATAALGVTTLVLAVFTNWAGARDERQVALVPARDSLSLVLAGHF